MAVDKGLYQAPQGIDELAEQEEDNLEVEIAADSDDGEEMAIVDIEDGTMEEGLAIMDAILQEQGDEFGANLAEVIPEEMLQEISDQLLEGYEEDLQTRSEWAETYEKGLDLLGLKMEERTEPWQGASAVTHPIMAEAVVKFQSETMVETFPPAGPVRTKIIGEETTEATESAKRVQEDMNILFTEKMEDYRAEHERLLWHLPLAGSAFKKVYYSADENMPIAQFVPAEDFIVNHGASTLKNASRYTHRMRRTWNEIRRMQINGFYRDVELGDVQPEVDEIQDKKDEITGYESSQDDRYRILEVHCELDIEGFEDEDENGEYTGLELPYVVTIEKSSGTVLSVYRNWREDDPQKKKRIHFSKYDYIPGFGFYGFGLIHLIGGFTKGATSLLRQLIDSGTLANLQGGFKTRGMRMPGGDTPIAPGEYRDVDVPTGTIKENIMSLPYKEPSLVLANLLEKVVEEARRFASVADLNVADMQANAPMGSTLAILERQLKTMTAVQARVHAGMKQEFKLVKQIIVETLDGEGYEYDAAGDEGPSAKAEDYRYVEIIPVSDPNASSMSQRIAQYQAVMQMVQQTPGDFDTKLLNRQMIEALGIDNAAKLVPMEGDLEPMDPVTENMRMLTGEPVKAHMYQDHQAHIAAHMAFGNDPKIQEMLESQPDGQAKMAAGMAHINEHMAFAYRRQIEEQLGVGLPNTMGEEAEAIPEDVEVQLSRLIAQASQRVLGINQTEQQAKQAQQAQNDPMVQQQMHERKMAEAELQRKREKDKQDFEVKMTEALIDMHEAEMNQEATGAKIGAGLAEKIMAMLAENKLEVERESRNDERTGFQEGLRQMQEQRRMAEQAAMQQQNPNNTGGSSE